MYAARKYGDKRVLKSFGALLLPAGVEDLRCYGPNATLFVILLRLSSDGHLSALPRSVPRMGTFHLASSFTGNRSIRKNEMLILLLHVILKQWSNI